jgi:hypothetical protein
MSIKITKNSRYSIEGKFLVITENEIEKVLLIERRVFGSDDLGDSFSNHLVQDGDRLDNLAYKFGNDPTKWWLIAEMNDLVQWPLVLVPGSELKIPFAEVFSRIG